MSLSWSSSEVRVHLAADALVACLVLKRLHGRSYEVVDKRMFVFAPGERAAAFSALADWMRQLSRRTSIAWVLGHCNVNYLLLPWSPELVDDKLRDSAVQALFEQQSGLDASRFEVRFARAAYGRAQLVALVQPELLADIVAHAHGLRRRLRSISPGLTLVWTRFAAMLINERGVFSVIDGHRQIVLRHRAAQLDSIALLPFGTQGLERFADMPPGECFRFFSSIPVAMMSTSCINGRLGLPTVPGFDNVHDAGCGFALAGVL